MTAVTVGKTYQTLGHYAASLMRRWRSIANGDCTAARSKLLRILTKQTQTL